VRNRSRLRSVVIRLTLGVCVVITGTIFGGPVVSGAVFLLMPADGAPTDLTPGNASEPLHKGSIDLATGLYVRRNEDLIVDGEPPLVLRRTYLSGYRVSQHFGIGATHDGEIYLVGDSSKFQWIELILANGSRVRFDRTSAGTSFFNAMFESRRTPGEWRGARLGWTGLHWALRRRDGSLMLFQGCATSEQSCSIIRGRDAQGRLTQYRRDNSGRLTRMEASDGRWIAFDYDAKGRISRAFASDTRNVRYEYDDRGRLTAALSSDGGRRAYGYTDLDEMATIREPGTDIQNSYEGGRCVEQVNHFPDKESYVFRFTYRAANGLVVQTDSDRSDGSWLRYTWGPNGYATSETWGQNGLEPAVFTYERDTVSNNVTALTVTCPDRSGRPLRHSSIVRPDRREEDVKWEILTTHCSWAPRKDGAPVWRAE
jgi:YD repeat-containing protein